MKYFRIPEQDRIQAFKGMCGPGFLKNESNEVREEFQKVWFDENLSIDQKQAEFKRIAALRLKGNAVSLLKHKAKLPSTNGRKCLEDEIR